MSPPWKGNHYEPRPPPPSTSVTILQYILQYRRFAKAASCLAVSVSARKFIIVPSGSEIMTSRGPSTAQPAPTSKSYYRSSSETPGSPIRCYSATLRPNTVTTMQLGPRLHPPRGLSVDSDVVKVDVCDGVSHKMAGTKGPWSRRRW